MSDNRLVARFEALREKNEAAFMPFLTAGDPDCDTTAELIIEADRRGADVIELGIPFSDPIADGPTIQASFTRALGSGASVKKTLQMLRQVRESCSIPIVTMVSFSIVNKIGVREYLQSIADAGADGVIVPDLPVEEGDELIGIAGEMGLCVVFLVAPTTTRLRAEKAAVKSTGFIYYISVAGTTGARASLPEDVAERLKWLKSMTDKPVALGFGVSTPEQAALVARVADGVIVGSAIVKKIAECAGMPRNKIVSDVGEMIGKFVEATKKSRSH